MTKLSIAEASCADDYDPNSMPVDKARAFIHQFLEPLSATMRVPIRNALGRVLAEDVISPVDVPSHRNSAMDGWAMRGADLVTGAQTTLDPQQMKEWTPNSRYGGHAFGFSGDPAKKISQFDEFLAKRETILPWIAEYSPYALVSADDPPVYLYYSAPPALGQDQKDPTHTSNFGVKLQEHCRDQGVTCELYYPKAPTAEHKTVQDYLLDMLKSPGS